MGVTKQYLLRKIIICKCVMRVTNQDNYFEEDIYTLISMHSGIFTYYVTTQFYIREQATG